MDKPLAGPNPGLLTPYGRIVQPDKISPEEFKGWYEEKHIPDIFKVSHFTEAHRWENINPAAQWTYVTSYPLQDLGCMQSEEFQSIPVDIELEKIPGSHKIFDFVTFDMRGYRLVQLYEPETPKEGEADFVVSAAFTPSDEADYDAWYRQEHLKALSGLASWRKTERYELLFAAENGTMTGERSIPPAPKYLTLHYLSGESFPEKELMKAGESEWSMRVMSSLKENQIDVFKRVFTARK